MDENFDFSIFAVLKIDITLDVFINLRSLTWIYFSCCELTLLASLISGVAFRSLTVLCAIFRTIIAIILKK